MLSRMWRSQLGAHFWQKMFGQALGGTAPRGALTELFLLAALLPLSGGGGARGGGMWPPSHHRNYQPMLSGSSPEAPRQDLVQNGQFWLKVSFLGALRKLLGRIWSKMDNFCLKCPLWELSGSSWAGSGPKWTILA